MTNKQTDMLNNDDTENNNLGDNSINNNQDTLGTLLKAAREKQGASVAEIADQLHLRPCIVHDIEADLFDNIGSPTYIKGYVKNYARIVKVDIKAINACIAKQVPVAIAPQMQSFSQKTTHQARDGRLMLMTYLLGFILLALLVVWWVQKTNTVESLDISKPTVEEIAVSVIESPQQKRPQAEQEQAIVAEASIENVQSRAEPELNLISEAAKPNANTEPVPTLALDRNPQNNELTAESQTDIAPVSTPLTSDVGNPASPTQSNDNTPVAGLSQLSLDMTGDCWISIIDANGKVWLSDLKKAGSRVSISGVAPFKLTLGAPQSVSLEFNGEPISLAKFSNGRVARFTLPISN